MEWETVSAKLTAGEKELAEKMARYWHQRGKIDNPSVSSVLRFALRRLANETLSEIERRRFFGEA